MIQSFRHKALKAFWMSGTSKGLRADWLPKLRRQLIALDVATKPNDMNVPGWRFHHLSGQDSGRYSVRVTGNYRLTFGWHTNGPLHVDLEDYH